MNHVLDGSVAIVTGASGGLGSNIVYGLARLGAKVAIVHLENSDGALEVHERSPGNSLMIRTDVTREAEVEGMVEITLARFGKIDILVNCAGIYYAGLASSTSLAEWQKVIDVNLTGVFITCKAVIPHMRDQSYGRIINISSFGAQAALTGTAAYCASKAGVIGLTRVIGNEVARWGITANVVSPGTFDAGIVKKQFSEELKEALRRIIPINKLGTPEELTAMVCFLASPQAGYITRQVIGVDGGI